MPIPRAVAVRNCSDYSSSCRRPQEAPLKEGYYYFRKRARQAHAFTIIELLIIIGVIGFIAVAVITPTLDFTGIRVSFAARKVQSDIRYAQQLAMALQLRTRVLFQRNNDRYRVQVQLDPDVDTWTFVDDPLTHQNFQVNLATGDYEGVFMAQRRFRGANAGNRHKLIFDETGAAYAHQAASPFFQEFDRPAYVTLSTNKSSPASGTTRKICVKAVTGKAEIVELSQCQTGVP